MDILLTRYFYPCFLFECTCCNLPATITIETSFLVLQIEITGNFSLHSFEHCKEGIPPASSCSADLSIYIEGTSSLITLSPSLVDPALVSVVRAVDGQETGLSVQPTEKKNRLQTGQDFIYRAHWSRLLCF